jgi:hypothetical protein
VTPTPDERTFALLTDDADAEWRRWTGLPMTAWSPEALASFCVGIPALEQAVAEHGLSAAVIEAAAAENDCLFGPDGDEGLDDDHHYTH